MPKSLKIKALRIVVQEEGCKRNEKAGHGSNRYRILGKKPR